ncbi:peroxide stress protein YaaA [Zooshikella ganghwensis]|uniref:peroxide stress protein YaaA n=1 Tax=Zooshikella ganghwensis TaxID=202772 RepID=UPI00040F09CD|nr:peroxide stress protein YaaA [Zooshikella ganghwensis]
MLMLISPAKTLDFASPILSNLTVVQPQYTQQAAQLIEILRQFSVSDISQLMKLSDKLASLNVARYASWQAKHTKENSRPAIYAFKGDVYTGLDIDAFSQEDLQFANTHLGILSGLYGLLQPLTLIQPYRLEMGTKLLNPKGKSLYDFWQSTITTHVRQQLDQQGDNILINLASNEYFSAIDKKSLNADIITPSFKDYKNGTYKIISMYAKKARGMMARYIIQNKITHPAEIKQFNEAGYQFNEQLSTNDNWVFIRKINNG